MTHLQEKMEGTVRVWRWECSPCTGGNGPKGLWEYWNWAEGAVGIRVGRIGRGWQKLKPRWGYFWNGVYRGIWHIWWWSAVSCR